MSDTEKPVDSGVVDSSSVETKDQVDVTKLQEELAFERKERIKFQSEAKKAFQQRDEAVAEREALKEPDTTEETASLIKSLRDEIKQRDDRLTQIAEDEARRSKLDVMKAELAKQGLKQGYEDRVLDIIDLSRVDPTEPISATIVVDAFKNSWGDLFSTQTEEEKTRERQQLAGDAWNKPKFSSETTVKDYEEQYNKLCREGRYTEAQQVLNKLDKLKGIS